MMHYGLFTVLIINQLVGVGNFNIDRDNCSGFVEGTNNEFEWYWTKDHGACRKCKSCTPGTYLKARCPNNSVDSECMGCPFRTYNTAYGLATFCKKWSTECVKIKFQHKVSNGTHLKDITCECIEGFFLQHSSDPYCSQHTNCSSDGRKLLHKGTPIKDAVCEDPPTSPIISREAAGQQFTKADLEESDPLRGERAPASTDQDEQPITPETEPSDLEDQSNEQTVHELVDEENGGKNVDGDQSPNALEGNEQPVISNQTMAERMDSTQVVGAVQQADKNEKLHADLMIKVKNSIDMKHLQTLLVAARPYGVLQGEPINSILDLLNSLEEKKKLGVKNYLCLKAICETAKLQFLVPVIEEYENNMK